jgi:hypothetical protein
MVWMAERHRAKNREAFGFVLALAREYIFQFATVRGDDISKIWIQGFENKKP